LLTLTTDYTVTINANGTGTVTLVATAGTSNITIVGGRTVQRTTDFVTGGDFFANTLNDELDSQTIFIQQIAETAERGMKAPVTDPTDINMTLPSRTERAGKYLAFDEDGNPQPGDTAVEVAAVYAIRDEIVIVAGIDTEVVAVAGNATNINTVATNIANVNSVGTNIANVNATATNITNVNAVGADLLEAVSEINTVATSIANVDAVGTNISNVNSVAGNATNINAVAGNATNINTVATNNANVTTVAGISANVTTVAGISANVTSVAGNSANINTVSGISGNVTTVAGVSASVTTVAGISADVTTVATNVADITNFSDVYLGPKTTNPTVRNDASALQAGDLYFNTVDDVMKVYTGAAWSVAYVPASGFLLATNNLSDLTSASTARTNLSLGTLSTQNANSATITGGSINGTTIGATTASTGAFTTLSYTSTLTGGTGVIAIGTNQIYKDASGFVGLGTATPTDTIGFGRIIDIQSATGAGVYLRDSDVPTTSYTYLGYAGSNSTAYIWNVGNGAILFGTNDVQRLSISAAGTVALAATSGLTVGRTAVTSPASTDGNVFSGTYTPSLTNTTNIAASSTSTCQYMRVGDVVTVSGQVTIDPTAAGACNMKMTLPIASAFGSSRQAGGTFATLTGGQADQGAIIADATGDQFEFRFTAVNVASAIYAFHVTYSVA
jgi:hypothetical protein